jgi:tetratricopeptide (TPR) repeat protein
MNPVKQINTGAVQIASGDFDEAIETLTQSLSCLKQGLECYLKHECEVTASNGNLDLEFLETPNSIPSILVETEDGEDLFVYQEPCVARWATISVDQYDQLSFAVMYNLALAHHLKYVDDDKKNRSCLEKAKCLYEYAHYALVNQTVGASPIHLIALTNNLGYCNSKLGNNEKAHACLIHLLTTLMYLVERGESNVLGKSVDGFFKMASSFLTKSNPAAAA